MSATMGVRLLREAAHTAGPPILAAIVGVASEIFQSAENVSHNRSGFLGLARRIEELVNLVTLEFDKFGGADDVQWPDQLLQLVDELGYTLLTISEFVQSHSRRGRIRAFIFQERDTTALQHYEAQIQAALDVFKTQSYMAVQMHGVLTKRDDDTGVFSLLDAHAREVDELMRKVKHPDPSVPSTSTLPRIPARPAFLFGRDGEVQEICDLLVRPGEPGARVAVLGAPGMGKTAVALAAAHNPVIVDHFNDRRVFVACDSANDAESLLSVICSTLGVTATTPAAQRKALFGWLGSDRTLLVLDNFETPWDPLDSRSDVEDLLTAISDVSGLALLVTLRGAERPHGPAWTRPFPPPLAPLARDAASHVFSAVSDIDGDSEAAVGDLLALADGLPLAIRLLASMVTYESCTSVLERWTKAELTPIVTGQDDSSALEVSISLSLSSPRMTLVPNAERLLAVLSLLPDGTRHEHLEAMCNIPHASRCANVLLRTGLAYRAPDEDRIRVLAPIRAIIIRRLPPSTQELSHLCTRYMATADVCESYPEVDDGHLDIITHELGNAESVLRYTLTRTPEKAFVRAVLGYNLLYQRALLGSPAMVGVALTAARVLKDTELLVDCLLHCANSLWGKRGHDHVQAYLEEAASIAEASGYTRGFVEAKSRLVNLVQHVDEVQVMELARTVGDPRLLISVILRIGGAYEHTTQLADAKVCYEEAVRLCRAMDKPDGGDFASAIGRLGDILVVEGRMTEALPLFEEGVRIAQSQRRQIDEANCQRQTGTAYMSLWEYRLALKYLGIALNMYRAGGWTLLEIAALVHVAWSRATVGELGSASQMLDAASSCLDKLSSPWKFGRSMVAFARGDICLFENNYEEADAIYRIVRHEYQLQGMRDYEAELLKRMGFLALVQGHLDDAESHLVISAVLNRKTGEYINIAIALNRLADVWLTDGDERSALKLSNAIAPLLVRFNGKKELADVKLRMARIAHLRQQSELARDEASRALREYSRLEWSYGIEQCRQFLNAF